MRRRPAFLARAARRLAGGLAKLVVLTAVALGLGFCVFLATFPEEGDEIAPADAIVVLTGGDDRIADAMALLAAGKGSRVLITGIDPAVSRERLIATLGGGDRIRAAFDCCVDLDWRAQDTPGNAAEAARWAAATGARSLIVVTAGYHMPRALLELRAVSAGLVLTPAPVTPARFTRGAWARDPAALQTLAAEYVKLLASGLRLAALWALNQAGV